MTEKDSASFLQHDENNTTRVGRLLVKFYLDELPQLLCIMTGKMSVVGLRPRDNPVYEQDLNNGDTAHLYLRGGLTDPHQFSKAMSQYHLDRSEECLEKCQAYEAWQLVRYDLSQIMQSVLTLATWGGHLIHMLTRHADLATK